MRKSISLDAILDGFNPTAPAEAGARKGTPLTLWVPVDLKERYDRIQQMSGRKFSAKIREIVEAAITKAEAIAS